MYIYNIQCSILHRVELKSAGFCNENKRQTALGFVSKNKKK